MVVLFLHHDSQRNPFFECLQVAEEVFQHLVELFDYYVYAVFMTFFLEGAQARRWHLCISVLEFWRFRNEVLL